MTDSAAVRETAVIRPHFRDRECSCNKSEKRKGKTVHDTFPHNAVKRSSI